MKISICLVALAIASAGLTACTSAVTPAVTPAGQPSSTDVNPVTGSRGGSGAR